MQQQEELRLDAQERREQLFTERYQRLLRWAMELTNQQRARAEDLVQDAFIQFSLGGISVEQIVNIDGYLRQMLRYIHLSRRTRNAEKVLNQTLSLTDYESFHQGSQLLDTQERLQIEEELHRICAYACARKETSKAGAVLILRFFHEYCPSEIAKVARTSRHCIDQWQRVARLELKAYLTDPDRVRFVGLSKEVAAIPHSAGGNSDLLGSLRQIIFQSRRGDCLAEEKLQTIYGQGSLKNVTTSLLGHLVSCIRCLDTVNQSLGIPSLTERYRYEPETRQLPPDDRTGGGSSGDEFSEIKQTSYRRRRQEVFEHKPKELRIAVNGSISGALTVNSELSEMELNLDVERRIKFVEVLNEADQRLLLMPVDSHSGFGTRFARIELSDERTLEVWLSTFYKTVKVVYREPVEAHKTIPSLELVSANNPKTDNSSEKRSSRLLFILNRLASSARLRSSAATGTAVDSTLVSKPKDREESERRKSPRFDYFSMNRPWFTRIGWISACVSLLLMALVYVLRTSPPLTATSVLQQATIAESITQASGDQIIHRVIHLEESLEAGGPVLSKHKIESWRSADGESAHLLYNEENRLIAGRWIHRDGSQTVYHHGSLPIKRLAGTDNESTPSLSELWQLEPSATWFQKFVITDAEPQLEVRSDAYIIRNSIARSFGDYKLLTATLALSRPDMRAIEQTMVVNVKGQLHAYRFVETGFERVNKTGVPANVFDNVRVLETTSSVAPSPKKKTSRSYVEPKPVSPPIASTELEVEVAHLLDKSKEDRHEQLTLSRDSSGVLLVEGVVESEQRKAEILSALAGVRSNPAVKIHLVSVTEVPAKVDKAVINRATPELTSNAIAVDDELRRYFSSTTNSHVLSDTDELIRVYSSRMVNRSYRMLLHAIELNDLASRFAKVDMHSLAPGARAKWTGMLHRHARKLEGETVSLRGELERVFRRREAGVPMPSIGNDLDLMRAIKELHALSQSSNTAIRDAFTISTHSSSRALKTSDFWTSLAQAELLAKAIQRYAR